MERNLLTYIVSEFFFMDNDLTSLICYLCWIKLCDADMMPRIIRFEEWMLQFNKEQFYMFFRMVPETFDKLDSVIVKMDEHEIFRKRYLGGHYPIERKIQILIFVYYMATQETLIAIGNRFKVSAVSVMNIINRLLYFVLKLKKIYIKFPNSEEELQLTSRGFIKYPGVVGALDGTHIFVNVENEQQDSYIDRYWRHSINIMAICNSNRLFTYIFVGFPGSAHDSRVFHNSNFYRDIERYGSDSTFFSENYHLIGDSAFALKKWIMTPYKDNHNLNRKEKHHNYCLSTERVVIEHSFGQLKGRWRRLKFINTYNMFKTVEIATAGCVLHNFCLLNSDFWNNELYFEQRIPIGDIGVQNNLEGILKRTRIADELFANLV